jgi:hypothetical protein
MVVLTVYKILNYGDKNFITKDTREVTMNKQTALQWYIEQCENIKYNPLEKNGYTIAKEKITNQALEMEKEQSISDYCAGFKASGEGWNGEYGLKDMFNVAEEIEAEKYYQETYGETKN